MSYFRAKHLEAIEPETSPTCTSALTHSLMGLKKGIFSASLSTPIYSQESKIATQVLLHLTTTDGETDPFKEFPQGLHFTASSVRTI